MWLTHLALKLSHYLNMCLQAHVVHKVIHSSIFYVTVLSIVKGLGGTKAVSIHPSIYLQSALLWLPIKLMDTHRPNFSHSR